MPVDRRVRTTTESYYIKNTVCGLYTIGLFVTLVQGFIFWRMGQSYSQVMGLSFRGPRVFSFTESQILSLAPGPVTGVRTFLPINIFVFRPAETITIDFFLVLLCMVLSRTQKPMWWRSFYQQIVF
jgi:hypothetical protein